MEGTYLRDSLSLYELATLSTEQATLAGDNVALFLTVTSAYLVAAYFSAKKLKRSQIRFLNALYISSSIYFALGFIASMGQRAAYEWLIPRPEFAVMGYTFFVVYSVMLFVFMLASIPMCTKFMNNMQKK